jgi:hypothetical protein
MQQRHRAPERGLRPGGAGIGEPDRAQLLGTGRRVMLMLEGAGHQEDSGSSDTENVEIQDLTPKMANAITDYTAVCVVSSE